MRFKVDENLPVEVADLLRRDRYDALTVLEQHLGGSPDSDLAQVCQREGRVLITLDLDFADIRRYPPADYPGVVVLRPDLQTIPTLLHLTTGVTALLAREPIEGYLWLVDERRVRIRGGGAPGNRPGGVVGFGGID